MKTNKNYVYFIEGRDNVGKTTAIQNLKNSKYVDKIRFNKIEFSKYPTNDATNAINRLTTLYKQNELNKSNMNQSEYIRIRMSIIESLINTMIGDMIFSFIDSNNDMLKICDRGFLSTYLYQYRNMPEIPNFILDEEIELRYLRKFISKYLPETSNDINIIILNNNANPLLADIIIDDSEIIEYKRNYDNDIELQTRINNSLNNIIALIQHNKLEDLLPIKFYYINIFDDTGSIRKTSDEICNEIISIINKEE